MSEKNTPNRKDSKQVSFRISDEDFDKLSQAAKSLNMTVPAFVKSKAKGTRMTYPKIDRSGAKEIATELRRIGSNVNQIAKHLNQGGNPSKSDLEGIQRELQKLWLTLSEQLEK